MSGRVRVGEVIACTPYESKGRLDVKNDRDT